MNAPLRKVSIAVLVLFGLLFANLNWVQFAQADRYREDSGNVRVRLGEYDQQRGNIVAGEVVLADSRDTGGELRYQRFYPLGAPYAHVVGWKTVELGKSGIEDAYNKILNGEDSRLFARRVSDMVTGRRPKGGNVLLTLSPKAQQTAFSLLGNRTGAVVALDPKSGAVLAAVSTPSYDPGPLASHDPEAAQAAMRAYQAAPGDIMLNRALNQTYPPGSTFKVVVSAAALENGMSPNTQVEVGSRYDPPQTDTVINNDSPGPPCSDQTMSLERALTFSCNTAFARLCVERLGSNATDWDEGGRKMREMSRKFGFENTGLEVPLKVAPSRTGEMDDAPKLAQSCFGQRDVRMTPLQGAMIAGAVANGGSLMTPNLMKRLEGPDFGILEEARGDQLSRVLSGDNAGSLRQMMESVVRSGTGQAAQIRDIRGVTVGGKTGTAENAGGAGKEHGWFIGYAMRNGEPAVAVAVVLEQAGEGGSREATRIAGQVMRTVLT